MKALVITKAVYDYIMPLVEYPKDGDTFYINEAINSVTNVGSMSAITLGKYGVDVNVTSIVGEDEVANKIKEIFKSYQVKTECIETNYQEKTSISYKIYNSKTNKFTSINEIGSKSGLTKFKYEFIPDVIIMDNKDTDANLAALNNYPKSKLIYIADKFNKESNTYLSKCNYVISNLEFASAATGVVNGLNKSNNIVALFQKFVDLYNSNLIIKLDNFDILYCINDEVRLIKNINKNITNKDNIYISVLIYFLTLNYDIETSIKLTNKVMLNSQSELDLLKDIPDYNFVTNAINDLNAVTGEIPNRTNINNTEVVNNNEQNVIEEFNLNNNINNVPSNNEINKEINNNGVNNGSV